MADGRQGLRLALYRPAARARRHREHLVTPRGSTAKSPGEHHGIMFPARTWRTESLNPHRIASHRGRPRPPVANHLPTLHTVRPLMRVT